MKPISLPNAELKPALTGLSKIIQKHSHLPVLKCVKIERTSDGWIALTATDLDQCATVRLEQPVEGEPATVLVPFDELLKTSKSCSKSDAISVEGEKMASGASVTMRYPIGGQHVEHQIESFPVEEFPSIPRIDGEPFPVNDLVRSAIHEALECASTDETRVILNAAFLDVSNPKRHHVIGTDGRHLYSSNSFDLPLKDSLIVPAHKFLGWREFNNDGEWQLKAATDYFQISSRRWQFIGKQIEGNYPNWRQVLPTNDQFNSSITLNSEIIRTIERMPCHDPVNLSIGIELIGKKVCLLGKSTNDGKWTKVEIPAVKCEGKSVTAFLNRQLLIKALKFGLTRLELIDSLSPMRSSNEGRLIIVMPTRPGPATPPQIEPAQESDGKGEAEPVNSEADNGKPVAPSTAAPKERSNMTDQPGNGASTAEPSNGTVAGNEFDAALEEIEMLKESLQESLGRLKSLSTKLKIIQRGQRVSVKEFNTVRQTLRNLQGVKL
jgi:DNA polymerase III sliding clamp (beta) subunit (PCNA family)